VKGFFNVKAIVLMHIFELGLVWAIWMQVNDETKLRNIVLGTCFMCINNDGKINHKGMGLAIN
jgi:hypothetical protein